MCVSVFVCMLVFASFSSVCITEYHSVYLPVCLSCLSVSPCVPYLSDCQSVCSIPVSFSVRVYPYLSVSQSVCFHTCQSVSCQSVNPCVSIPVSPSVSPCVSIPVSLSVRVYPHLSVCQSVCIHTCQSECQSVSFHTCQSVSPCVSTPVSLSVCMYPYLSVCLSCLSDFCVYVWLKGEF